MVLMLLWVDAASRRLKTRMTEFMIRAGKRRAGPRRVQVLESEPGESPVNAPAPLAGRPVAAGPQGSASMKNTRRKGESQNQRAEMRSFAERISP